MTTTQTRPVVPGPKVWLQVAVDFVVASIVIAFISWLFGVPFQGDAVWHSIGLIALIKIYRLETPSPTPARYEEEL